MSLCVDEGYQHDYDKFRNKGAFRGRKKALSHPLRTRRCADDDLVVVKTLYDPAGTLSKKQQKRLTLLPINDFQFRVPYSLNKHNRWENINPKSLLVDNSKSDREVLVVNGVVTPYSNTAIGIPRARSVHLLENDVIATISTSGKAKEFAYFNAALRELKEMSKEEPEAARIQFNILKPDFASPHSAAKSFRKKNRRACLTEKLQSNSDDYEEVLEEESFSEMEEENLRPRSSLTLGDFVANDASSYSQFVVVPKKSHGSKLPEEDNSERPILPQLVDISQATRNRCIFEVFDIKRSQLKPFDLREKVTALVPTLVYGRCVVRWFDPARVSISNQPLADTVFALFFEQRDNLQTLRVRCNTNTRYGGSAKRATLLHIIETASDFDSLLNNLMDFIWESRSRQYKPPEKSPRICMAVENFKTRVNSDMMAATAGRCVEHEQMLFVKEQYSCEASNSPITEPSTSAEQEENQLCCLCQSSLKTDLFPSLDGVMCKDCISSQILHQIRLNQFPIRIPLLTVADCSPLDLLYAILPVPLMSVLIRMSFSHFYSHRNPEAVFTQCPLCEMSLLVKNPNDFHCCICPDCKYHFCHRCLWEPHWPMSCEEMNDWSQKWDEQYLTERFLLDKDEKVLRITCACNFTFYVPESIAHGTYCPRKGCDYRFDKNGLMRNSSDLWWWYTARERQKCIEKDGKMRKWGIPTEPEHITPRRVIKKEFAFICADARKLRFNEQKREKFKQTVLSVTQCKCEQHKFIDTRRTGLLLVEHCTAWMYIHRDDPVIRDLKPITQRLLQHLYSVERNIEDGKLDISTDMEQIEKEDEKLISAFRKALLRKQKVKPDASTDSDSEAA